MKDGGFSCWPRPSAIGSCGAISGAGPAGMTKMTISPRPTTAARLRRNWRTTTAPTRGQILFEANAWIQAHVQQVDAQIDQHKHGGQEHDCRLDHDDVAAGNGVNEQA